MPARNLAILLSAGLVAGACAPAEQADPEADRQAIEELRAQETQAFSNGDVASLMEVFTEDCTIMPPEQSTVIGHEAQREWLESLYAAFDVQAQYLASELELLGDHAIERIQFQMNLTPKEGGEPMERTGTGLHVYERQADGSWKISHDIWNFDATAEM